MLEKRYITPSHADGSQTCDWLYDRSEISCGAKIFYGILMFLSDANGIVYVEKNILIEKNMGSEKNIDKYISELSQAGLIEKSNNFSCQMMCRFLWHHWFYAG